MMKPIEISQILHYNEAMAYLRKVLIRRPRSIPNALTPWVISGLSRGIKNPADEVRKLADLKPYKYDYWAIYESKRIGNKVRSKMLYSFGHQKRKPSIETIKYHLKMFKDLTGWKKEKYGDKLDQLIYAVPKLLGKKGEKMVSKIL